MNSSQTEGLLGELPAFADVPPGPLPVTATGQPPTRTGGFRLAVFPTTVGQYWRYLLDCGLQRAPEPRLHGFTTSCDTGLRLSSAGAIELDGRRAALPVTRVSWHGAQAYCDWLTRTTGAGCRLPSAAEWQYAAAGPAGLRWALGDEFDRPSYAPAATGPRPVLDSPANSFGLRGLTGNVFEWCSDELVAPSESGPRPLGSRVIKGGAYTVRNPESFENATVFTADELSTVPYIGFRVLSDR